MYYLNVRESRSGNQRMDSPETRVALVHTQIHKTKQNRTKQKQSKKEEK